MTSKYPVQLSVTLRPVQQPWVKITAGDQITVTKLCNVQTFDFDLNFSQTGTLTVEHFDKADLDPDTAVEVVDIGFFGIHNPKFVWAGMYTPQYPPHLQDRPATLPGQSYLSWNGHWQLTFGVPVFTWIHQTLNWGWLYT